MVNATKVSWGGVLTPYRPLSRVEVPFRLAMLPQNNRRGSQGHQATVSICSYRLLLTCCVQGILGSPRHWFVAEHLVDLSCEHVGHRLAWVSGLQHQVACVRQGWQSFTVVDSAKSRGHRPGCHRCCDGQTRRYCCKLPSGGAGGVNNAVFQPRPVERASCNTA